MTIFFIFRNLYTWEKSIQCGVLLQEKEFSLLLFSIFPFSSRVDVQLNEMLKVLLIQEQFTVCSNLFSLL